MPELAATTRPTAKTATTAVEIVIPVHDEERDLERSVRALHRYLSEHFAHSWAVTVADNASTDATWAIALRLASELDHVGALHLDEKGRGRALRTAWAASRAEVVAYMDVDLSTDLDALLPLVAPLLSGHSDVAIGTRLASSARVVRGPKRELISRSYNLLLRTTLRAGFSDAQCGFKAMRADVARRCSHWSRTRAGSSTPSCSCSPSTTGCASTRFRSTGSTTPSRGSTSSTPRSTTSAASGA